MEMCVFSIYDSSKEVTHRSGPLLAVLSLRSQSSVMNKKKLLETKYLNCCKRAIWVLIDLVLYGKAEIVKTHEWEYQIPMHATKCEQMMTLT